jgi:hypothetical protein
MSLVDKFDVVVVVVIVVVVAVVVVVVIRTLNHDFNNKKKTIAPVDVKSYFQLPKLGLQINVHILFYLFRSRLLILC